MKNQLILGPISGQILSFTMAKVSKSNSASAGSSTPSAVFSNGKFNAATRSLVSFCSKISSSSFSAKIFFCFINNYLHSRDFYNYHYTSQVGEGNISLNCDIDEN